MARPTTLLTLVSDGIDTGCTFIWHMWTMVCCMSTMMQSIVAIIKYADITGSTVQVNGRLDVFYRTVIRDLPTTSASASASSTTPRDLLNTWLTTNPDMLVEIHHLLGVVIDSKKTRTHNTRSRTTILEKKNPPCTADFASSPTSE